MINPFEQIDNKMNELLKRMDKLEEKIFGEKRWLNVSEAAKYLGYSKDHIHKLKSEHLMDGVHYHKVAGRVLFDKLELDYWVTTKSKTIDPKEIVNDVLKGLT